MELWEITGLAQGPFPCVVAVAGSGGKTSLIGKLADEGKQRNCRVAVLTTTRIRVPYTFEENYCTMKPGTVTIFGKRADQEKLAYPGDLVYREICAGADLILVEADGSRGLPMKLPDSHEPVIPGNVHKIFVVHGMKSQGQPLGRVCHRAHLEPVLTDMVVTPQLAARLLEKWYGNPLRDRFPEADFRYVCNQADTAELAGQAFHLLASAGQKGVVLSIQQDICWSEAISLQREMEKRGRNVTI